MLDARSPSPIQLLIACSPAASHCRRAAFIPDRHAGRCSCTYKRYAGSSTFSAGREGRVPQSSATLQTSLRPKRRAPHLRHLALGSAHARPLDRFQLVPPRHYRAITEAIEIASSGGHSPGVADACQGTHGGKQSARSQSRKRLLHVGVNGVILIGTETEAIAADAGRRRADRVTARDSDPSAASYFGCAPICP